MVDGLLALLGKGRAMNYSKASRLLIGSVVVVALVSGPSLAFAKPGDLLQTFFNPTSDEGFSNSVAAVGNNVLIGAYGDSTGGANAGAAYLYDGSTGALLRTFLNPTPAASDLFGYCVAAVGNNILVGAYGDDAGATNSGTAHLFNGSTGALLRTFLNPNPSEYASFGTSVAAVGNNILIGADCASTGASNSGAAYLFDDSTGALLRTFVNPTPETNDLFGTSVAAVGNNIVLIGTLFDDAGAPEGGAAYIFNGSTGALLRTFTSPTPEAFDFFSYSVAAVGNNILIGAPLADVPGAAYLFDGSTGDLLQTFLSPTAEVNDFFGWSVAAVGDDVLIGSYGDDTGAADAGAAYLFDGSTGALLQTFLSPTPGDNDAFGWSVAAVGNNVLVGAMGDGAGAVYMFEGIPEPATLSLLALLALSLPKRGGLTLLRRKSGCGG
jgi:hypothetical protein